MLSYFGSGAFAVSFALVNIFSTSLWQFVSLLWLLLFCGAAVLPACAGILVSIVPNAYRTISSSITVMAFNLFGYFLSLTLSGYLMQLLLIFSEKCDLLCARVQGFRLVMLWSIFSLAFLAMALETLEPFVYCRRVSN